MKRSSKFKTEQRCWLFKISQLIFTLVRRTKNKVFTLVWQILMILEPWRIFYIYIQGLKGVNFFIIILRVRSFEGCDHAIGFNGFFLFSKKTRNIFMLCSTARRCILRCQDFFFSHWTWMYEKSKLGNKIADIFKTKY